jgi:hypothetical protein
MKKIIISGKENSGKSFLTEQISKIYNKVFFLTGRKKDNEMLPYKLFHGVTEETDLIIVDDATCFYKWDWLLDSEIITVNTMAEKSFKRKTPDIIINCNYCLTPIDIEVVKNTCIILECSNDNGIFDIKKLN